MNGAGCAAAGGWGPLFFLCFLQEAKGSFSPARGQNIVACRICHWLPRAFDNTFPLQTINVELGAGIQNQTLETQHIGHVIGALKPWVLLLDLPLYSVTVGNSVFCIFLLLSFVCPVCCLCTTSCCVCAPAPDTARPWSSLGLLRTIVIELLVIGD